MTCLIYRTYRQYEVCPGVTDRIKLVLSLHVSPDEEDVVDRLLDDEGQSPRLRLLRTGDELLEAAEYRVEMAL